MKNWIVALGFLLAGCSSQLEFHNRVCSIVGEPEGDDPAVFTCSHSNAAGIWVCNGLVLAEQPSGYKVTGPGLRRGYINTTTKGIDLPDEPNEALIVYTDPNRARACVASWSAP